MSELPFLRSLVQELLKCGAALRSSIVFAGSSVSRAEDAVRKARAEAGRRLEEAVQANPAAVDGLDRQQLGMLAVHKQACCQLARQLIDSAATAGLSNVLVLEKDLTITEVGGLPCEKTARSRGGRMDELSRCDGVLGAGRMNCAGREGGHSACSTAYIASIACSMKFHAVRALPHLLPHVQERSPSSHVAGGAPNFAIQQMTASLSELAGAAFQVDLSNTRAFWRHGVCVPASGLHGAALAMPPHGHSACQCHVMLHPVMSCCAVGAHTLLSVMSCCAVLCHLMPCHAMLHHIT